MRDRLTLIAPTRSEAERFLDGTLDWLKQTAANLQGIVEVSWENCDRPFRVHPKPVMAMNISDANLSLLGADYCRLLDCLMQWRSEGRIVWIVSNVDDRTLHVNDLLSSPRSLWTPNQFIGYDYKRSWRADFNDYERLNPEYDRLKQLLEQYGRAIDYDYSLFRTVDSAKVRYQTTYYLCRDYCGIPVRVGVSRPSDYSILQLTPV